MNVHKKEYNTFTNMTKEELLYLKEQYSIRSKPGIPKPNIVLSTNLSKKDDNISVEEHLRLRKERAKEYSKAYYRENKERMKNLIAINQTIRRLEKSKSNDCVC